MVLKLDVIRKAYQALDAAKGPKGIHSQFTGYLGSLHAASGNYTRKIPTTKIEDFCRDFMAPGNATEGNPYFAPWARTAGRGWLAPNLQGSYAPSSPRKGMPDVMVPVDEPKFKGWSFKEDHAELALRELLHGKQIVGYDLAVFLLRDFGFATRTNKPQIIKDDFQKEFGLNTATGKVVDGILFNWTDDIPDQPFELEDGGRT